MLHNKELSDLYRQSNIVLNAQTRIVMKDRERTNRIFILNPFAKTSEQTFDVSCSSQYGSGL
jgi:hypothetical protein